MERVAAGAIVETLLRSGATSGWSGIGSGPWATSGPAWELAAPSRALGYSHETVASPFPDGSGCGQHCALLFAAPSRKLAPARDCRVPG